MLQTALVKESARARTIEFASLHEGSIARTQIEHRDGLVFMRMKKRCYVFT